MSGDTDRVSVRLAELVAALSLGVDLGFGQPMEREHARIARLLGEQLNLSADVLAALASAYEQWNGDGWPGDLRGDEVPLPARLAQLAEYTEVAHRIGGVEAAKELARGRAGKQ